MSWTASFGPMEVDDTWKHLYNWPLNGEETSEHRLQFQAALRAAHELAHEGVVGAPEDAQVFITLSGHANEGHQSKSGWSDSWVSISLYKHVPDEPTSPETPSEQEQ